MRQDPSPSGRQPDSIGRYFARYLGQIQRFPMLDPTTEYELAKRFREHGDEEAARRLVTSHLRLVAKIAFSLRGYGLPLSDLISEGSVGMMQALRHFDPDRGSRLSTYAAHWIRAAIQDHVLRSWSLVKIGTTPAQRKLFFNLRKSKARIAALDAGDLPTDAVRRIASDLDVPDAEVVRMNRRLADGDDSLTATAPNSTVAWQDRLADEREDQETQLAERDTSQKRRALLRRAFTQLGEREREIIFERHFREDPVPLRRLAERHGVSVERVRQIEARAFDRLKKLVRNPLVRTE
jgi:RNA polymerase sigma-32 factor